jgi:hypothetical protein
MKLFRYKNFIKESKEDIDSICKKFGIENYTINEDSTIDVDGDVNLHEKGLTKLPLKFGKVSGHFNCISNQLKSLEGSPLSVGGGFYCQYNQLESLSGAPLSVGGYFDCGDNQLISLEGAPLSVGGGFYCRDNQLISLEGSPLSVGGDFSCSFNQLISLEGISGRISGGIYCSNNQLRDVKGVKDGWLGEFSVYRNPVHEIFKLFPYEKWDEVIEILNEYEVIRDNGNLIILQRLEQVFLDLGLEVPEIEEIKGYKIRF